MTRDPNRPEFSSAPGDTRAAGVSAESVAIETLPDTLDAALAEVARDAREGNIPDLAAAVDAVIMRIVALRFGHLPEHKRQRMLLHVHELMHNDPLFLARVEGLLEEHRTS